MLLLTGSVLDINFKVKLNPLIPVMKYSSSTYDLPYCTVALCYAPTAGGEYFNPFNFRFTLGSFLPGGNYPPLMHAFIHTRCKILVKLHSWPSILLYQVQIISAKTSNYILHAQGPWSTPHQVGIISAETSRINKLCTLGIINNSLQGAKVFPLRQAEYILHAQVYQLHTECVQVI